MQIPVATPNKIGGVKQGKAIQDVTAPDSSAVGESYNKLEIDNIVNEVNGCKGVLNGLLKILREAGIIKQ